MQRSSRSESRSSRALAFPTTALFELVATAAWAAVIPADIGDFALTIEIDPVSIKSNKAAGFVELSSLGVIREAGDKGYFALFIILLTQFCADNLKCDPF